MDKFFSLKTISETLGLEPITIRRWVEKGLLKAYKLGKEYRVKKSDFDEFLQGRRTKK